MADVLVCCVKWGGKYSSVYANRLHSMVQRNLIAPHDFACLTDDSSGLNEGIEVIPLPPGLQGYWNKISLFRDDLFEPGRTVLYMDVDVVVVGSLDFTLDDPGGFRVCRALGLTRGLNSSVMRFQAGEQTHVHESFRARGEEVLESRRYVGDQDWISEQVREPKFFPAEKIVSYKKDLDSHMFPLAKKLGLPSRWLKAPQFMTVAPPPEASIVVFHGKPDPEDVMDAPYGPWKRAPFVKEHWR